MKKKDLLEFIESLLTEYPPIKHLNIVNAFRTLTEKIRDPKLINNCKWPKWFQIYKEGRASNEIVEDILSPTKTMAAISEPNFTFKPKVKRDLDVYKEAELILFRPSTVLKKFKIDMASGLFVPALMLLCSGQKVPRSSEETKRVFPYCLDVLSRVVDEFFRRYDPDKSTHQKAIQLLFGKESGLHSVIKGKGRQINRETLRTAIQGVRTYIGERIKGRKAEIRKTGRFYTADKFYYIAWLASMIMELYYPVKPLRKEHAIFEMREILSRLSIRDRKDVLRTLLSELEKNPDTSIDGRHLFVPGYFRNLPLAISENSYKKLRQSGSVGLGKLIDSIRHPSLGYTD